MRSYATVDDYLADAPSWRAETVALRAILRDAGLEEAVKWGKPCYAHNGGNVAIVQPFKAFCALLFFKGSLFADPEGLLRSQGRNTQGALRLEFASAAEIARAAPAIRALIAEAIRVEEAGLKPDFPAKRQLDYPAELVDAFDAEPDLRAAFEDLTPGRQRAYILHFTDAKRSATRAARIAKHAGRILQGRGLNDR